MTTEQTKETGECVCICGHGEWVHLPDCQIKQGNHGRCKCKKFTTNQPWSAAREAIDKLRDCLAQMEWADPTGSFTLRQTWEQALGALETSIHDHETMQRRKDQQ